LVERLLYTQNVGGSSPSPPTSLRRQIAAKIGRLRNNGKTELWKKPAAKDAKKLG
jgi:hypothetical protein